MAKSRKAKSYNAGKAIVFRVNPKDRSRFNKLCEQKGVTGSFVLATLVSSPAAVLALISRAKGVNKAKRKDKDSSRSPKTASAPSPNRSAEAASL